MSDALPSIKLGYSFRNSKLLEEALTHRSYCDANNERLEYLGDAILGFLIAEILYTRFPEHKEGALTRMRSTLVKRETLAGIARSISIGSHIKLGTGERKSGGWRRDSILANALEALIGAVYIDSDIETCRLFVQNLYADQLLNLAAESPEKDPKTRLQELLQARKKQLPVYEVIEEIGEAHDREFVVSCLIGDLSTLFHARGRSKREAEQLAASRALKMLESGVE
ncbi:MAG: ribonuclease III [Gammaproteobacteria bacterium RIFCSPLOWO2_02_FULL_56_15]|nr:MAG: ribonuclease III [Gammaproteobacteria bacterium RIFCSPLOWO2_02_FULL_56_15]